MQGRCDIKMGLCIDNTLLHLERVVCNVANELWLDGMPSCYREGGTWFYTTNCGENVLRPYTHAHLTERAISGCIMRLNYVKATSGLQVEG